MRFIFDERNNSCITPFMLRVESSSMRTTSHSRFIITSTRITVRTLGGQNRNRKVSHFKFPCGGYLVKTRFLPKAKRVPKATCSIGKKLTTGRIVVGRVPRTTNDQTLSVYEPRWTFLFQHCYPIHSTPNPSQLAFRCLKV